MDNCRSKNPSSRHSKPLDSGTYRVRRQHSAQGCVVHARGIQGEPLSALLQPRVRIPHGHSCWKGRHKILMRVFEAVTETPQRQEYVNPCRLVAKMHGGPTTTRNHGKLLICREGNHSRHLLGASRPSGDGRPHSINLAFTFSENAGIFKGRSKAARPFRWILHAHDSDSVSRLGGTLRSGILTSSSPGNILPGLLSPSGSKARFTFFMTSRSSGA